jgi:hypothetical protein
MASVAGDSEPPRGLGRWDTLAYGHHRAVVRVEAPADAVVVEIRWRRPDRRPEAREIVVVDAATGVRVADVVRIAVTRESGTLAFRPASVPGDYLVDYLPFQMTGRTNYPTVEYPKPVSWADSEWLSRNGLQREPLAADRWRDLPRARVVSLESSDAFSAFTPMEEIATAEEMQVLLAKHPSEAFLLFPEDRAHPIRLAGDLPKRWIERGAFVPLEVEARPGEFLSVQVGLCAVDRDLEGVTVQTGDVRGADGRVLVPGSALHSFATRGVHSANQYNPRDGFASSANLYLEHLPFVDRLWLGEYFDYDSPPDYWLVEVSGIPFGLMGEMLEKGGNPWRGMLFGMTGRLPWAGDPRPLWKAWDAFGLAGSCMKGWWVPDAPVRTDRQGVFATTYARPGRALVALASWEKDPVDVALTIDWKSLGLDPSRARLNAPAVEGFQPAASFAHGDRIRVEPGRGWLLVLEARQAARP